MKRLWSAFTDNMDKCLFTGSWVVERHHIFGGVYRKKSEKYGFVVPLRPDLHPNGVYAGKDAKEIDTKLKCMAQEFWEGHYGTRKEFMEQFGRNYL